MVGGRNTSVRTELRVEYDKEMHPVSATCTSCGEKMPKPPDHLKDSADIIMWLSQRYLEHKEWKHRSPTALTDQE